VNMTYYSEQEVVAGMNFEVMKVVRIKRGWSKWLFESWHNSAASYLLQLLGQ
jgi:hypothetical protein